MMAWVSVATMPGRVFHDVREELDLGSPRATAIVGAAFVEDHLQRMIQARLVDDQKVVEQIFGPSSALGSFSAKINVGYLMGLYSREAYLELDCIRKIRNDFAHELHINSFDLQTIKDRCANLRLWETTQVSISKVEDKKNTLAIEIGPEAKEDAQPIIIDFAEGGDRSQPRVRYVGACRFYIALFSVSLQFGKRPEAPSI
jgi:hypothetical protein